MAEIGEKLSNTSVIIGNNVDFYCEVIGSQGLGETLTFTMVYKKKFNNYSNYSDPVKTLCNPIGKVDSIQVKLYQKGALIHVNKIITLLQILTNFIKVSVSNV